MKEAISNRHEEVLKKEKVMFPEIVVRGTKDKPYYEIKYYDVTDKQWHLGYGSYNLEYVMQWKEECLEVVEGNIIYVAFEKIIERLEDLEIYYDNDDFATCHERLVVQNEVIEIVKEVAEEYSNSEIPNMSENLTSSDEFCEWRLCDEDENVYNTACGNSEMLFDGSPIDNNYSFCPYCGKKIKVVK